MKTGKKGLPAFCAICNRPKKKAINEQLGKRCLCASPKCTFKKEINDAINNKKTFKIGKTNLPKKNFKIK